MPTKLQIAGKLKFYSKPYGRQWKWRYQVHGHITEPVLKIPKNLQNAQIIDPLHPETMPQIEQAPWVPPRRHPILESFFSQPTLKDHPDYKHEPIKLFDKTIKFHAGIQQVCLLTKTKPISGLPKQVEQTQIVQNDNDRKNVESYIRQALAYNPTKEHVAGIRVPTDPKFKPAGEYGTSHYKQMKILLQNLIRLSCVNGNKANLNNITERKVVENSPLSTIVQRADDTFQIRCNSEFTLFSKKRLELIADANEIKNTSDFTFVDMYPIFPTIDLKDEHVYKSNLNMVGLKLNNSALGNVHTFFHIDDDKLSDEVNTSRLIMFAFGHAHAKSKILQENKKLELNGDLELKNPIVINGVSISNGRFNYVTYQMNTLSLNNNSGIKNIVYYDMENELYSNVPSVEKLPYPSLKNMQRMALRHLEYNPTVFQKFQSLLNLN